MKVKLVVMIKDEAAYLPYWIFHHLHFGFDCIEIHINRCQYNTTAEVLDKVVQQYPQVSYRSADWVDAAPPLVHQFIQQTIYAECYWRTKAEAEFTHVCFLDVDEFWTPRNFTTSIHQCLSKLPEASTISFNWLNVLKEDKEFSILADRLLVQPAPQVKSVINLKADISKMGVHLPRCVPNQSFTGHILSDGRVFKHADDQYQRLAQSEKDAEYPYFILHRMYRTQMEYVASLAKPLASSKTAKFKVNRPGYLRSAINQQELTIASQYYQTYCIEYEKFLKELDLMDELELAHKNVYEYYNNAIALLQKGPSFFEAEEIPMIKKIFSGVDDVKVKQALVAFE